tara:strand:+ start:69 stop:302 length:234 start_codon:yes stop_codon:yes gene_type:complete
MRKNNIENIVKEVLNEYIGTQINIDSATARDHLAKHIAAEVESELKSNKLTQKAIDESTAWSPPRRSQHVDGCGYDD